MEAAAPGPRLPIELFLPVLELLERRGMKRTLANLISADKLTYEFGFPFLMKTVDLRRASSRALASFGDVSGASDAKERLSWKHRNDIKTFSARFDSFNAHVWRNIIELILPGLENLIVSQPVTRTEPTPRPLKENARIEAILGTLGPSFKLKASHLDLDLSTDYVLDNLPRSVKCLSTDLPHEVKPLLASINRLPPIPYVRIASLSGRMGKTLAPFVDLIPKIRRLAVSVEGLKDITKYPGLCSSIRGLDV
jgi:hypothetical protein